MDWGVGGRGELLNTSTDIFTGNFLIHAAQRRCEDICRNYHVQIFQEGDLTFAGIVRTDK